MELDPLLEKLWNSAFRLLLQLFRHDKEKEESPYSNETVHKLSKKEMADRLAEILKKGSRGRLTSLHLPAYYVCL